MRHRRVVDDDDDDGDDGDGDDDCDDGDDGGDDGDDGDDGDATTATDRPIETERRKIQNSKFGCICGRILNFEFCK